eukprot:gnl/MRDRNA2_/MRDRNA2_203283_c0_seq1.p1 gnl/MRDRNA2_/MRDRNA2_203283_c0~~gnl/MRDRNA2_/MRDRNA2_203283_c0_seq1.p1  ORF type:complete len:103 (-),score=28.24 gnl/MRDRNA2_/MRDRNA2_203283_c0_seq1:565-873(-)
MILARLTEQQAASLKAQELANKAWAFAKAVQTDAQLFAKLAIAAEQCMPQSLGEFTAENAVKMTWAFGMACCKDSLQVFTALARMMEQCSGELTGEQLAKTA